MKNKIFTVLFILFSVVVSAQNIKFISANSGAPLPQVFVFDSDGKNLAESDINGNISTESLKPFQKEYILYYENEKIGILGLGDLNKEIIKLNDRVRVLETLVIKDNSKAKYLMLKGNFNANVLVDGYTNAYADGIVTHVFDNKTKKYLYSNIEQYRAFNRSDINYSEKSLAERDLASSLGILAPRILSDLESAKKKTNKEYTYREVTTTNKDVVELKATRFDDKVRKILGIWITQLKGDYIVSFEKGSKKRIQDFYDARLLVSAKIKYRSEKEFHNLLAYRNFYPTEVSYTDQEIKSKIKFKPGSSSYTTRFWETDDFPVMKDVLSKFTNGKFKEAENKISN